MWCLFHRFLTRHQKEKEPKGEVGEAAKEEKQRRKAGPCTVMLCLPIMLLGLCERAGPLSDLVDDELFGYNKSDPSFFFDLWYPFILFVYRRFDLTFVFPWIILSRFEPGAHY